MNATRFALFYFSGRADAKAVLHKFGDGTPGSKSTMPRESVPYKTEKVLFIHVISICAHRGDRLGIGSICARSKIAALPPIACIAPRSDSAGGSTPPLGGNQTDRQLLSLSCSLSMKVLLHSQLRLAPILLLSGTIRIPFTYLKKEKEAQHCRKI